MTAETSLQRKFYDMLMDSQWWSADQLRDYQRSQLTQLLHHAKKNVPFYEHRLDAVLKPNGDIDWDRWSEIPIVKRQDMIDHRGAMQATEQPVGHGPMAVVETSGSTGVAISVTTNALMTIANNGLRWRGHEWNELDWSKSLCIRDGADPAVGNPPSGIPAGPWGPGWDVFAQTGRSWVINKLASERDVLDYFVRRNCSYLVTGPKTAHAYAMDAVRLGLDLKIEAFLCQGGAVDEEDREICREVFGARLIEHYSSKESGHMASVCSEGHLHINSECVLIEILDDDGRPSSPGATGRVTATPLFSTAQPLIRYEQGDLAVAGTPCACGRAAPVLERVVGRQVVMFRHPDGRTAAQVLPPAARRALDCAYLQIAKVGPNTYEARYLPRDAARPPDEAAFIDCFRQTFFSDSDVVFQRLQEIPMTPVGKTREYVDEWDVRNG